MRTMLQSVRLTALSLIMLFPPWSPVTATPNVTPASLPLVASERSWPSLYHMVDWQRQRTLEARLHRDPLWSSLLRQGKMAVGVVDLTHPESPRFMRLNGNSMMYAASLPKIAVLLAAFQAMEDGTLPETPEIMADLHHMIRYSNNDATTRIIERLGFRTIATVLTAPSYRLFDMHRGGGLWVGKTYAQQGQRYPDPLQGLSHAATVTQVCRFYYFLATGRLINPERSAQMLTIMGNPGINHKFVAALANKVPKTRIFRKSGTWRTWHADSVLVWSDDWRRYILVALIQDEHGEQILRNLVPAVEEVLRPNPMRLLRQETRDLGGQALVIDGGILPQDIGHQRHQVDASLGRFDDGH